MANDIIITPVSASIQFSGSANASIKLTVDASGSLSITGNSGSLFSITDNLSGSLMSVNTIAGLPILEVFSDNRVNIGKYASEAIKIQSGGSDVALGSGSVMFVTSSGRVGIGTTIPNTLLNVGSGTPSTAANGIQFGSDTSANLYRISTGVIKTDGGLTAAGNITIAKNGAYLYLNGTNGDAEILWQANSVNKWAVGMNVGDATQNFNIYNYTTTTTNLTILSASGNVGIGTANPTNKLDVVGNISCSAITASLFFGTASVANALNTGNSYTIANLTASNISSSGVSVFNKTGFGTSSALINASPMIDVSYGDYQNAGCIRLGADLGVNNSRTTNARKFGMISSFPYNNTSQSIFVIGADAQSTTVNAVNIGGGSGNMASPTRILFFTTSSIQESGTERMRIDGSGNVGIGTTSPNTLLNVGSGTPSTAANGIQFGSDTSANLYRISTGVIKTDGGLTVTGTTNCTAISVNGTVNVYGVNSGYIVSRRDTSAAAWQWYSQTGELRLYDQINALDRLIVTTAGLFTFTSAISASSFTGSVFGTSSFAISASYAPGGSGLTGGTTNYIPLWTGATTQGISVISQSGTIIGLSGSLNVLQNVTASLFNGLNFVGGINTISSSTTTTIDLRYAVTQMQLSQSITTFAHSNATSGTATWMLATVGAGTAVTITWPTSYKWPGGVAPSLTTTSAKRDVYQFMSYDGSSTSTGYVFATVVAQNM